MTARRGCWCLELSMHLAFWEWQPRTDAAGIVRDITVHLIAAAAADAQDCGRELRYEPLQLAAREVADEETALIGTVDGEGEVVRCDCPEFAGSVDDDGSGERSSL